MKKEVLLFFAIMFSILVAASAYSDNLSQNAPIINNAKASAITTNSATITWTTDKQSTSIVRYGLTPGNFNNQVTGIPGINHGVPLAELTPGTFYYFVVNSTDDSGNSNQSPSYMMLTLDYSLDFVSPTPYDNQYLNNGDVIISIKPNTTLNSLSLNFNNIKYSIIPYGQELNSSTISGGYSQDTGSYYVEFHSLPPGKYSYSAQGTDLKNNILNSETRTLTMFDSSSGVPRKVLSSPGKGIDYFFIFGLFLALLLLVATLSNYNLSNARKHKKE